jgi:hypothetical protein
MSRINAIDFGAIVPLKNSIYLFFLCTLFSCEQDFLSKDPLVGSTVDNFYQTEADALAAVNAAYAPLQFETTPAGHFRWFWGDIMSDDAIKGGSGDNDQPLLAALENFQGPVNTEYLSSEWTANYEGINRANVVLEKVPGIVMNESLKQRYLGEARFIRAWFYYNLVTVFGGVPLVDHLLAPNEYNMPRATESEIWAFIESDLQLAIAQLPVRSAYPAADLGRVTKGAAQALLMKTMIWQKRWAEAAQLGDAILQSGQYALEPNYGKIFTLAGENGPESIFEIQYMTESGGNWGYNANNEGTFTNVFQRARGQFEGYGFNIPTQELVDAFFAEGSEDPRLKFTVFRLNEPMGDRGTFTLEATGGFPHRYYARKYFSNRSEQATFGDPNPNGGSNDRVIRLADVLLLHAEANYHLGKESEARSSLNKVRARVSLAPVTASSTALLQAIYRERRVELALEGHRFFDLVRTGQAATVLGPLGYKESTHRRFPIPQSQILATNGAIVQNPGY